MSVVTISKKELKAVVKESVKEIFEQEAMKLRAFFVPLVSSKEQKEIEKNYGKPSRKVGKSVEIKI